MEKNHRELKAKQTSSSSLKEITSRFAHLEIENFQVRRFVIRINFLHP